MTEDLFFTVVLDAYQQCPQGRALEYQLHAYLDLTDAERKKWVQAIHLLSRLPDDADVLAKVSARFNHTNHPVRYLYPSFAPGKPQHYKWPAFASYILRTFPVPDDFPTLRWAGPGEGLWVPNFFHPGDVKELLLHPVNFRKPIDRSIWLFPDTERKLQGPKLSTSLLKKLATSAPAVPHKLSVAFSPD